VSRQAVLCSQPLARAALCRLMLAEEAQSCRRCTTWSAAMARTASSIS